MPNQFDNLQLHEQHHILNQMQLRERLLRYSIALFVPTFGALGLLAVFAHDGAHSSGRMAIVVTVVVTTVPMAIVMSRVNLGTVWWSKQASIPGINTFFLVYADIGVTIIVLTFISSGLALHVTALFAIIGCYAAHFVTHRVRIAHMVYTSLVVCGIGWMMWLDGQDLPGVLVRVLVSLLAINGTVALLSIYTDDFQSSLRTQLKLANTDALTGLFNRRGFLYWTLGLIRSEPQYLGVIVADVDNYKRINDRYGHDVGDVILKRMADTLQGVVGAEAILARMGGDEFALATTAARPYLAALAERMRVESFEDWDGDLVTISLGVAVYDVSNTKLSQDQARVVLDKTLSAADGALYRAKQSGRNHVRVVDVTAAGGTTRF